MMMTGISRNHKVLIDWKIELRRYSRSVRVLRGKMSWQLRPKDYHKVTQHNKTHTRDLLERMNPGGWLPLLKPEAAKN